MDSQLNRPVGGPQRSLDATPPFWPVFVKWTTRARRARRNDLIRLIGLTLYYLAIIAGLALLYGGAEYTPPPFIYQGF
jgi:hypothetical protein